MLYPLVWQLAEFRPFATAFETILSESYIRSAELRLTESLATW